MEIGDAAAWFAAGIAIIAAGIAMSSSNSAKTQARAALKQAAEAEKARKAAEAQVEIAQRAAEAAERSAHADESAVALAARQAHEAMEPKFEFQRHRGHAPRAQVKMTMTDGPALAAVIAQPQGLNAELVLGFAVEGHDDEPQPVLELGATRKGDTYTITVHCKEITATSTVAMDLRCVPVDQDLQPWTVAETFTLTRAPVIGTARTNRIPTTPEQRGLFHDRRQF